MINIIIKQKVKLAPQLSTEQDYTWLKKVNDNNPFLNDIPE